jgi:hypothetical protein
MNNFNADDESQQKHQESIIFLWIYFISMLQRLDLLFLLTFQRVKERNIFDNLGKKAMDKMSVVEQSMEMNIETASHIVGEKQCLFKSNEDSLVALLWPFFLAFDEMIEQWIKEPVIIMPAVS